MQPTPETQQHAETLEALLGEMLAEHEALLRVAATHREAIATADAPAMQACTAEQSRLACRLNELERRRGQVVARMAQSLSVEPAAGGPGAVTVNQIAQALPETARNRVLSAAGRLRDAAARLLTEHRAVRIAAEVLAEHMQGVIEQVSRRLSHAGTYGSRGAVESRVQVLSTLDLTT